MREEANNYVLQGGMVTEWRSEKLIGGNGILQESSEL